MSALEDALKLAAEKGMTHLTMWPVPSQDRKTTYWYARATPSTGHSYVQTTSTDPVEAVVQVLQALPRAPKRASPQKNVTAAVTEKIEFTPEENAMKVTNGQEEIDKWLPQA